MGGPGDRFFAGNDGIGNGDDGGVDVGNDDTQAMMVNAGDGRDAKYCVSTGVAWNKQR